MRSAPLPVMPDLVFQPFLQRLADALVAGDADRASRFHLHPLIMYTDTGPRIEMTREDTVRTLHQRCARFRLEGIASIAVRVLQAIPRNGGRVLVQAIWSYRDAAGTELGSSDLIYYCALQPNGSPLIEMLEVQWRAFDTPADVEVTSRVSH